MAPNFKKPFIVTGDYRYRGEPITSSSAAQLANSGVHKLTLASTYTLQGPQVGSLVTIYAVAVDASLVSKTSTGGQVAFDGHGGTPMLNLLYDSTTLNDPSVTLIGESATQWRIIGFSAAVAFASSNAGISVSS